MTVKGADSLSSLTLLPHVRGARQVMMSLGQYMKRDDLQRLSLSFHPWQYVSNAEVRFSRNDYEGLIEAEKLYVEEVEKILERVATRAS